MKKSLLILICLLSGAFTVVAQKPVVKTNNMKVYMHYMPWFETPETIGRWGWHWTMNNKNPNIVDANGKRQIASHYYPLIGPYASRDKDVIEYHLLLMKLSGIDGVLINWYGTQGSNGDIRDLLISSDSIISHVDDFGLQFGVVMEDRFSRNIDDAKANMRHLKNNYFNKPEYIRYGANQDPLVGIFGPITFQQPAQWTEILAEAGEDIEYLTLWFESGEAGTNADGEYAWVYQDNNNHINHLQSFYTNRAPQLKTVMGSAYPGFYDYYKEGAAGSGYFYIPHNYGNTLDQTLAKLTEHKNVIDLVQLVTWNDFGEGTIFEPTLQTGFDYLKKVQKYTGVSYSETELRLVHKLYQLRKQEKENGTVQQQLDAASRHLADLEIEKAKAIIDNIPIVTGLLDWGLRDAKQNWHFQVYPNPLTNGLLHIKFAEATTKPAALSVTDLTGKVLLQKSYRRGITDIAVPVENLSTGMYLVRLQSEDRSGMQKVVVLR